MQGDITPNVICGMDQMNLTYRIQNSGSIADHKLGTDEQHNAVRN